MFHKSCAQYFQKKSKISVHLKKNRDHFLFLSFAGICSTKTTQGIEPLEEKAQVGVHIAAKVLQDCWAQESEREVGNGWVNGGKDAMGGIRNDFKAFKR